MGNYYLSENEEKLIEKYKTNKDDDIALYFFNKLGQDVLNILYSKVNLKFSNIPLEKDDLASLVWNGLKNALIRYKKKKGNLWEFWISNSYYETTKEIQKFLKNSELILNNASSWDVYQNTHCVYKTARSIVETPKESFGEIIKPIVEYVNKHHKTYTRASIKKMLYLKSFGYSEREIAKKMNVSRGYIQFMIKIVLKSYKTYLRTSNR